MEEQTQSVEIPITLEGDTLKAAPAEAAPGATVVWQAGSDTVSIWFPEDDVFGTRELTNRSTGDIEHTVSGDAAEGSYRYAIFSHGKGDFVQGGSHPVLIIKKP